jgi:hypothetical protein
LEFLKLGEVLSNQNRLFDMNDENKKTRAFGPMALFQVKEMEGGTGMNT